MPASAYLRAQRARRLIQLALRTLFDTRRLDAVIAPSVPAGPQGAEQLEYVFDGVAEGVIDALVRTTAPFNLAGLPAIAVPAGAAGSRPPGSVQIAGRPFDEATILRIARAIQRGRGPVEDPAGLVAAISG
jgi:aspartyl-tRNA(Asn)/glutamyl-tRNA(Gln) amidotransferase subunit A